MLVERVELRLIGLGLVEPFVAAHGTVSVRDLLVIKVETDHGIGWGECAALPEPTYTNEFAAGAFDVARKQLAPVLIGRQLSAESFRTVLEEVGYVTGVHPMTEAAFEMALLDAELKHQDHSVASWLGVQPNPVGAGAAVGLGPTADVLGRVDSLLDEGFRRVKAKIQPGMDPVLVTELISRCDAADIQLDANGSCSGADLDWLIQLAASGFTAIEQPFGVDDLELSSLLVQNSPIPIVADESAPNIAAVEHLAEVQAFDAVSVKAPRVGGLSNAIGLARRCRQLGLAMTAGGMIESGLGRHALVGLAGLDGFTIVGDVSPASRWVEHDPWPDVVMSDGVVAMPTTIGVAPSPDYEVLERVTIASETVAN